MTLFEQWSAAVAAVQVHHPNYESTVIIRMLDHPPRLEFSLDAIRCNVDSTVTRKQFAISTVNLTYWPGERAAQAWIACAWAGYLMHEALELVTVDGKRVLDPHAEPYTTNPWNSPVRDGLPPVLTPETLLRALCVVMPEDAARALVG